ncbi:hypothetical protein [Thioalkalivibrio sp. XN279]|uniref:hypothetical protein n=1 Tax=Thioalkalivibrio sp. XN279 TaxID=2714953 RepID=UPI00140C1054|nr:hypothetical protein [Thioalkalivibrio sp. XN279]NHA15323.1 hypothetical protein [Thioalkalivibrio sp. XN279]
MRSISRGFPAYFLLCLAAQGAVTALLADDTAPVPAEVPAMPPAVELVAPASAVEWTWIVPAAVAAAEAGVDADVDPDAEPGAARTDDSTARGELLTDKPPPGVTPIRLGTIRFQYEGDAPAPALRIVGTVPVDLDYVDGSATGPGAEVEYDAAARRISWIIAGPLDPGTRGLVSFRAVPAGAPDPEAVEAP